MSKLDRKDSIKINQISYIVGDLLKTLIYLPAEQLKNWLDEIGLSIPRQIRIVALKDTLREEMIRTRIERQTLADELNYRLSWFNEFSELQLENLLVFYNNPELDKEYYENLWIAFINYFVDKTVTHQSFQQLIDLSIQNVKDNGLKLENTKVFNQAIAPAFFDRRNEIDGLTLVKFRPVLYKSSTLVEIRELGAKYGVIVPKRLRKNELADIVVEELKDRGLHTEAEEAKIRSMSILVIQRYAIDNNIKASTELKKEEIIEYILKNAKETRETYFVPETSDVYQIELNDTSELPKFEEAVKEEPVVEDVIESQEVEEVAVVEEIIEPVEERVVERVVQSDIDLDGIVSELKALREAVANKETKVTIEGRAGASNKPDFDVDSVEGFHIESVSFEGTKKEWKKANKNLQVEQTDEPKKPSRSAGRFIYPIIGLILVLFLVICLLGYFEVELNVAFIDSITKFFGDLIRSIIG